MFQSTHPRRVRLLLFCRLLVFSLFQSTHPRRVRQIENSPKITIFCFNPRTRVGCDTEFVPLQERERGFNPRTRVGCDNKTRVIIVLQKGFNPRTRVGCDQIPQWIYQPHRWFQSTHPRRVRLGATFPDKSVNRGFNPRTRVGCDFCHFIGCTMTNGFNPRTRVGCDFNPV